ncbi:hypothetical protein [Microlunatus flavus]|uniref:Uncharacterized protein n=1 Tax=Microlunatus flavus TaxID=1036181 RepID=A0A1H9N871_9ACTN|nr:hypothetical protein [Microlunatus flavus]SER32122.1 hypothetical protein SAMN05421756_11315 [Microlunatus flavus]
MPTRTPLPQPPSALVPRPTAPPRPLLLVAALLGLVAAAVGAWLAVHPASALSRDPEVFVLRALLGPRATAAVVGALGLAGAAGALSALRAPRRRSRRLLVLALVEVAGFGVALQSVTTISLAGYLLAAALPLGVVVLLALVVRRYRRLRWPVLVGVLAVLLAVARSWTSATAALGRLGQALAAGFAAAAPRIGTTVLVVAVTAAWVLVVLRLLRGSEGVRTAGGWVLRHRVALTLVAAAGPLPYGLLRLTWLTPHPLLAPGGLSGEMRLWGLLLGGAALLGSVLTLGLVLPWGERFPRWFPRLVGRRVPVAAAAVPGGLVAGLLSAAAVPMLRMALLPAADEVGDGLTRLERLELALVFPFWVWGPALALAVWGYAQHRSVQGAPAPARG